MSLMTETARSTSIDAALRERARAVIPGGMYGHMSVVPMPPSYPQFYASGDGVRLTDVDGNEYLDLMCAFGPMITGYRNPIVDAAAARQAAEGDALGGPTARMVELAELMVDTVDHAEWAMFGKNGTDATSLAVMIARAATGKTKLLKGTTAYHGANAWFNPNPRGTTPADRADIITFTFNDLASLEAAASAGGDDVAAIIMSPFKHDAPIDQFEVEREFAEGARAIADRLGAVLILDEVRTGFRLVTGSAWDHLKVSPDLTAYSKAMGNGYAISAVVGIDGLRQAASDVFATGSFWYSGVPMAAAIANITLLRESDTPGYMAHIGQLLRDGLQSQADAYGFDIVQSGPTAMPFLRFVDDADFAIGGPFADAAVRRGVLLHPAHNWFLSTAHTEADIAEVLDRTDAAFAEVKSLLG
jgi:glutamate-1-semialdehyde 2,1-aminomutase